MKVKSVLATIGLFLVQLCLGSAVVQAATTCNDIVFSVDVPTSFVTFTLQAYQAQECKGNSYLRSPQYFNGAGLNSRINIVSLASLPAPSTGKKFIFTVDAAMNITAGPNAICGTCSYTPRDIIQAQCADCTSVGSTQTWTYSPYISSDYTALPSSTVIDSLAVGPDGNLLLSLDAPEILPNPVSGTTSFAMNDIVKLTNTTQAMAGSATATYAMFLSHSTIGLSSATDIVGFDLTDTDYYFMFGAPFTLGGTSFRSGYGYRRGKTSPSFDSTPFYSDSAFPGGSIGTDFMFPPSPGEVQGLNSTDQKGLVITKDASNLDLSWNAGCASNATGYNVYEGTIGSFTSYTIARNTVPANICNSAAQTVTVVPGGGNKFYIVVPTNGSVEGSYGRDSTGTERPAAAIPCDSLKKSVSCQ